MCDLLMVDTMHTRPQSAKCFAENKVYPCMFELIKSGIFAKQNVIIKHISLYYGDSWWYF